MNLTYSEVEPLVQGITRSLDSLEQSLVAEKPKKEDLESKRNHTHGRGRQYTKAQGFNEAIDLYDQAVNKVFNGRM